MKREAKIRRTTKETDIAVSVLIEGEGAAEISTGIGFLDHMLSSFCLHGGFNIQLSCKGDLQVDCHHTAEDIGIALGTAFSKALVNKSGISRYGMFTVPMDEALVTCNLDICNRPYLVFNVTFKGERIGGLETQVIKEFFYAFAMNSGITLHINQTYGDNDHHVAEAAFKALGHALKQGAELLENKGTLSTKGCL
ncbi:imidazoleglycerol-phosphate dehydratase HisB [Bacillota bacterium]